MKAKIASLLTAVMLTGLLSACGGETKKVEDDPAKEENFNATGFPIVNEPIELTFFTGKSATNGSNFEETLVWSEYQKKTNIKVNFQLIPFESLTEKRNLALASSNYPDAFYSARIPAADLMKYGSQGTFIPLNDLIDQYAPNLKKIMDENPDIRRGLTMPDGNIYSMPSIYSPDFVSLLVGAPLWVKKTWLDKLNMPEPTTPEEFYQYLKAVKETDLNGNGVHDEIPYAATGISTLVDQLKGAWGLGNRGLGHHYVDQDPDKDELRFFRLDPKFKEVIAFIHKLYAEDLIDKEIFTIKSAALYAKGQEGIFGATINPSPKTQLNQDDYIGLGALKGPYGDQVYAHMKVPIAWPGAFVITDRNQHPEETVRWMDHFYGDEGATFYFMGIENETYTKSADGQLEYIDDIKNNKDGLTMDQALAKYVTWLGGSYPGYVQQHYFQGSEALPESVAVGKKIEPHKVDELWSRFNYNEEEMDFMSTVGSDIETFITEMEAKFITGAESLDNWDKYVDSVKKMGVDKYMKIYDDAYKRYSESK